MLRKLITVLVSVQLLLTGCSGKATDNKTKSDKKAVESSENLYLPPKEKTSFKNLNDPDLMQYIQDNVYSNLDYQLDSDDYEIDNISTTYISKEYIEELDFNSKKNIYFGFTLDEINKQFGDSKFMFTLGKNGQTIVKEYEGYDDTLEKVIKNVAVGTGVILVCVTISAVTAGAGAPVASMIFAASAKTGTTVALSSGAFAGVSAGLVTALDTKDPEKALKSMAVNASEGFKWGAIGGAATGGLAEATSLYASKIPTARQSEIRALKKYGGSEQVSYLNGEEVQYGTAHSTRPDIITDAAGHKEAIEVKNYDLRNRDCVNELYRVLHREIGDRAANLPKDISQRVILDIKGRKYSNSDVQKIISGIQTVCQDVYPNLPVTIMG